MVEVLIEVMFSLRAFELQTAVRGNCPDNNGQRRQSIVGEVPGFTYACVAETGLRLLLGENATTSATACATVVYHVGYFVFIMLTDVESKNPINRRSIAIPLLKYRKTG